MTRRQEHKGPDGLTAEERCRKIEQEPLPASLNALLDKAVAQYPDRLLWSFVDDGVNHSYAQARAIILQMAAALDRWGVRKGDAVAVMVPNIVDYPVLWFALARLGAVIVPVNARYSTRELIYVIRKSRACRLVIHESCCRMVDAEVEGLLPEGAIAISGAKSDDPASLKALYNAAFGQPLPEVEVSAGDLVNIQFTSGTTGFPKGCELTHLYWLTSGKVNAFRDGRTYRRIWASTPFTYMDPQWLLLMAIYQHGSLYVAYRQSASRFIDWIKRYRINFCLMPGLVLKQPESPSDRENELIRANVYGLTPKAREKLERRFGISAREAFGMTEIGSGMFVPIEAEDKAQTGSCGRAAPFRRLRIVDEQGYEVKAEQVGELQVSGPGMMRGYFNEPESTARAFDGEWFRTGDLFWRDSDGYYYIVGRIKDSIRRAGENIAAREVEAIIRELDIVQEVAAIGVPDETRGEEIKICVVLSPDAPSRDEVVEQILAHASQNLAVFKRPRFICLLDNLPLTTSGKVAKQVLRSDSSTANLPCFDRQTGTWIGGHREVGVLAADSESFGRPQ